MEEDEVEEDGYAGDDGEEQDYKKHVEMLLKDSNLVVAR